MGEDESGQAAGKLLVTFWVMQQSHLLRRLSLPLVIQSWSLTSLQQGRNEDEW